MPEEFVQVQEPTPFSESRLWEIQNTLYKTLGLKAWQYFNVPLYVTNHPILAKHYAELVAVYLEGIELDKKEPIYILELGAGSGRFSYLFLHYFSSIFTKHPFVYVLVDHVRENLEHLETHPLLKSYFDIGCLDISLMNPLKEETFTLRKCGRVLSRNSVSNPLVVLANYFFDTVEQDLFSLKDQQLFQTLVELSLPQSVYEKKYETSDVDWIDALKLDYSYSPFKGSTFIQEYSKQMTKDCFFYVPSGAFRILDLLKGITDDFFLLSGDQGFSTLEQVQENKKMEIARHTSFSISVNYHCFAEYVKTLEGKNYSSLFAREQFMVNLAVCGKQPLHLERAFTRTISYFDMHDYWKFTHCLEELVPYPPLSLLFYLLKLGEWDPILFFAHREEILKSLASLKGEVKRDWLEAITLSYKVFFPIAKEEAPVYVCYGQCFQQLFSFDLAIECFESALELDPACASALLHLGLCRMQMGEPEEALLWMEREKGNASVQ